MNAKKVAEEIAELHEDAAILIPRIERALIAARDEALNSVMEIAASWAGARSVIVEEIRALKSGNKK